jgi:hypothetical protein
MSSNFGGTENTLDVIARCSVGSSALLRWAFAAGLGLGAAFGTPLCARGQQSEQRKDTIVPISDALCDDMKLHHVLNGGPVGCRRLKLVRFAYVNFAGELRTDGEVVVMDAAAKHVFHIFTELRESGFRIAKAQLMNRYDGNDDASMRDNNSSAFNDRQIVGGGPISLHAYGLAIDINPMQNPYVTRSGDTLTFNPPGGADYANRRNDRPWKKPRLGMAEAVVEVFAHNGFLIWGGYWDSPIDYQHFQVGRKLAARLADPDMSEAEAEKLFDGIVERYRDCRRSPGHQTDRAMCVMTADSTGREP